MLTPILVELTSLFCVAKNSHLEVNVKIPADSFAKLDKHVILGPSTIYSVCKHWMPPFIKLQNIFPRQKLSNINFVNYEDSQAIGSQPFNFTITSYSDLLLAEMNNNLFNT